MNLEDVLTWPAQYLGYPILIALYLTAGIIGFLLWVQVTIEVDQEEGSDQWNLK